MGTALTVISLILQGLSMAGNVAATQKAQNDLLKRKNELDLEYKKDLNTDFLNTPEAQSALSTLTKRYIENVKRTNQGAVIAGSSDERTVATAEKLHKPFQELIGTLAGHGSQIKEAAKSRYAYQNTNLQNLIYQNDLSKIGNFTNLAGNAGNLITEAAGADSSGAFDNWMKNFNKGTKIPRVEVSV